MATGKTPRPYWDTCVFLAWIKNEERAPGEMEGIAKMAAQIDKGDSILLTSVVTRIEILESSLDDAQKDKLLKTMSRRNIQSIGCDMRVADKAHEIRDYYQSQGKKLLTPDAIHLATAIIYNADCLYTFDGTRKAKSGTKLMLLPLNGDVAGYKLQIAAPMGQPDLFSSLPLEKKK